MEQGDGPDADAGATDDAERQETPPIHSRWVTPGVTIRDLTIWATARLPRTALDLRGGAPSLLGPTLTQLVVLAQQYPEVADRIGEFRLDDLPTGGHGQPDVYGRSQASLPDRPSALLLNRAYFSRPGRLAQRLQAMVRRGWHPSGTSQVESIVTHEFGHHAWFLIEDEGFDPRRFMASLAYDRRSLSGYAERDGVVEAWAEAFLVFHLGDEDARDHPLTRSVVQFIEQSMLRLRERRRPT
jgi:hypothetical protein